MATLSQPVTDFPLHECDEFWIRIDGFAEGEMRNTFCLKLTKDNMMALIVLINGIERT